MRIAASALLIVGASIVAAAGWAAVQSAPSTSAGFFGAPVVDLELSRDGGGSISGFLGASNFAPGDVTAGTLRIRASNATDTSTFDLDFDLRIDERIPVGGERLDDALVIQQLSYGSDDLLSSAGAGRDLIREIDGNPLLGNGDGRLSLGELQAGANDLLCPDADGGSPFVVGVQFHPESPESLEGRSLRVSFVFRLADKADADLN